MKKLQLENKIAKKKLMSIIIACITIILVSTTIIMASEAYGTCLEPSDNQYFELRAVQVKNIEGQNKQIIMELWGNNVEFKRI